LRTAAERQKRAEFCQERGVRVWQFYEWKNRLRDAEAPHFVEVEVKPVAKAMRPDAAHGLAIEVRVKGGGSVVLEPGFDAHHLRALLMRLIRLLGINRQFGG
jgi:hypothetical protein